VFVYTISRRDNGSIITSKWFSKTQGKTKKKEDFLELLCKIDFDFWCNPKTNNHVDTQYFHLMFILEFPMHNIFQYILTPLH